MFTMGCGNEDGLQLSDRDKDVGLSLKEHFCFCLPSESTCSCPTEMRGLEHRVEDRIETMTNLSFQYFK